LADRSIDLPKRGGLAFGGAGDVGDEFVQAGGLSGDAVQGVAGVADEFYAVFLCLGERQADAM
jgi:hypothetical protein